MLTAYNLSCGYVEQCTRRAIGDSGVWITIKLWRECGAYHVRVYDWLRHYVISWEVYPTYGKAATAYRAARRQYAK